MADAGTLAPPAATAVWRTAHGRLALAAAFPPAPCRRSVLPAAAVLSRPLGRAAAAVCRCAFRGGTMVAFPPLGGGRGLAFGRRPSARGGGECAGGAPAAVAGAASVARPLWRRVPMRSLCLGGWRGGNGTGGGGGGGGRCGGLGERWGRRTQGAALMSVCWRGSGEGEWGKRGWRRPVGCACRGAWRQQASAPRVRPPRPLALPPPAGTAVV